MKGLNRVLDDFHQTSLIEPSISCSMVFTGTERDLQQQIPDREEEHHLD